MGSPCNMWPVVPLAVCLLWACCWIPPLAAWWGRGWEVRVPVAAGLPHDRPAFWTWRDSWCSVLAWPFVGPVVLPWRCPAGVVFRGCFALAPLWWCFSLPSRGCRRFGAFRTDPVLGMSCSSAGVVSALFRFGLHCLESRRVIACPFLCPVAYLCLLIRFGLLSSDVIRVTSALCSVAYDDSLYLCLAAV